MSDQTRPPEALEFAIVPVAGLSAAEREEIIALCARAFAKPFDDLFDLVPPDSTHLLARLAGRLVGHGCWMTRWLQVGDAPPLRTAYLDGVAIEPALQGRGLGSQLIARVNQEFAGFELGGLSTERVSFYQRCGWERWRGPTFARTGAGLVPAPQDTVMIFRTPLTPLPLDLDAPLSVEPRAGGVW